MNKFWKIAVGFAALSGAMLMSGAASYSADMSVRKAVSPVAPLDCVWCGFVLGGDVAYTLDTSLRFTIDNIATQRFDPKGLMYGGHLGYLSQHGAIVLGIETEFLLGNMSKTNAMAPIGGVVIPGTIKATIDYMASVTGSLGILPFENTRLYVKGGPAWGHATGTAEVGGLSFTAPANHFGWVAGGGVDFMLGRQWLLGVEYKHFDLGTSTYGFTLPAALNIHSPLKADVVSGRLSYRFGT